ncbi:MAG TPA: acyl-CoA ligase (AMP-forming), exosortase A system-associated [Pseudonocardiaceae bacterium]
MRNQLHDLVAEQAARAPRAAALTARNLTLDYGALQDAVLAFAGGLAGLGLARGDRVAVYLDKRVETVVSLFGVSAAGGAFVPVNPLLRPRQLGHILDDSGARVLVTSADRFAAARADLAGCKALEHVVLVGGAAGEGGEHFRTHGWDEVAGAPGGPLPGVPARGPDLDVAAILYTSGSTGRPKGVVLSHRNLLAGAESVAAYLGNTADDRILAALPLSFDAGLSQVTTAFSVGAHVILMNFLLAGDVVKLCAKHRITGLTCVPPLWLQVADQQWPPEASEHLRYFANTGGRMPRATLARLREIFPQARPFLMYGLTEAFRSTYLDPAEVDRRPDSIGKAIPNAEILVVRPDGTECAPGEEGELVHRGALVSLGYWNDPERTAERFRPAPGRHPELTTTELAVWSGDLVTRDEDGFLYFVGRVDDMIKTSGYRVSPTEVEEVVYETGLVQDAVALGAEDPRLGQRIVLAVSPAAGTELDPAVLIAELRRQLPQYMLPSEVVVRESLPRSPNGKFDRTLLRSELAS